ncbi:MAG: precorrin-6A reductase [Acetatifactor sp.]|nr:precorrin-6A reductase [Acetatifactor sp.]
MSRVLIFAGTTEGRELAETLADSGVTCDVCVATEYGSQMMIPSEKIIVHQGRLDREQMTRLYSETGCEVVVDATHPYAEIVTETILESLKDTTIPYLRLLRPRDADLERKGTEYQYYDTTEECAENLLKTEGTIFLTTGSKELAVFCREGLKERLVVRVLPGMESLQLCYDHGLDGKQIIAMQGPFSKEINLAIMQQYGVKHLVTKQSGRTGGVDTKLLAAKEIGVTTHMIVRPATDGTCGNMNGFCDGESAEYSIEETLMQLEHILGIALKRGSVRVTLAGIGCGSKACVTEEVQRAIEEADYLFGAERMLRSVTTKAVKYPYYLQKDILPMLQEVKRNHPVQTKVTVLFSGDSGFYSGAEKLYHALLECGEYRVEILPGISSVSALSARIGLGWQDAAIVSLHGAKPKDWNAKLLEAVRYHEKTFFLTSGAEDIGQIGKLLAGKQLQNVRIFLGYQLSYENEKIYDITVSECGKVMDDGLYVGAIVNPTVQKRLLVPSLSDEDFIREKVPMTKEEVRRLSICKLQPAEGDVVYDIGSGTGSIAVQTALLSSSVSVYAMECNQEAVKLIRKNCEKFGTSNVEVIEGTAPEVFENLPAADCAFIGGSKGNLERILDALYHINPHMRVVANAVSMESICELNTLLQQYGVVDLDIAQVSVSKVKQLGDYHMLQANNPVYIYSFNLS